MNRINLICLGVKNMTTAVTFYRDGLGFKTAEQGDNPTIVFFNSSGTKLELYPLEELAKDIDAQNPPTGTGFAGITLAYNAKSKEEVDHVINLARRAGGKVVKEPETVFWGGYSGYFTDPDGYYWEVAWGPEFTYDDQDMLLIDS